MNVAALIAVLEAKGLSAADILDVVKVAAAGRARSSGAERQARYRDRKAARSVTSDVTRDVTVPDKEKSPCNPLKEINPPPSLRSGIGAGEAMLVSDGVEAETLADWKAVRKAKKAGPITETVAKGLIREASRAGLTTRAAVRLATERGWQGFRAEFVQQARAGPALRGSAAISDALDRILGDGDDQGKFEGIAGSVPGGGQRELLTYRDGLLDGD
jgi:hypothetical protein